VCWGYSGYFYQQMPDPAGLLNVQDGCWVTVAIVINGSYRYK
jgi:hypothetical protein